jgi:hypothetical protein
MVWVLERDNDILKCEIRQAQTSSDYEFEVVSRRGPTETSRFGSATELITGYLRRQSALYAQGWRPRYALREM